MQKPWEFGRLMVDWQEDWSQFFYPCNWRTFRFAHVEAEDDTMLGAFEVTVVLLGLGVRLRFNHTETDTLAKIRREVSELQTELQDEAPQ